MLMSVIAGRAGTPCSVASWSSWRCRWVPSQPGRVAAIEPLEGARVPGTGARDVIAVGNPGGALRSDVRACQPAVRALHSSPSTHQRSERLKAWPYHGLAYVRPPGWVAGRGGR